MRPLSLSGLAAELADAATHLPAAHGYERCEVTGYPPRICDCPEHREMRSAELSRVLRGIAGI